MIKTLPAARLESRVEELLELRTEANQRFFAAYAEDLARVCRAMAERFGHGTYVRCGGGSVRPASGCQL